METILLSSITILTLLDYDADKVEAYARCLYDEAKADQTVLQQQAVQIYCCTQAQGGE